MFARLAHLTTHRPRLVLFVTAVAVVLAALAGIHAPSRLSSGGLVSADAPSQVAADRLSADFGGAPNLVLLVHARRGTVTDPAVAAAGRALTRRLAGQPHVDHVSSYWSTGNPDLRSRNGTDGLVVATVRGDDRALRHRTQSLISLLSTNRGPVTVRAGGQAATTATIDGQITRDLARAESIAVPVTLVLLIVAFGSVVAALLPVLIGLVAIVATLAVLWLIAGVTDVSQYALNLTTAMGLGLAVDYSLLLVGRYREGLAAGLEPAPAVVDAVRTAGKTILFSGATVAAAMATLLVFPVYFLRSFAYAGVSVVIVAVAGALLVLPAVLTLLGRRVDALAVRRRPPLGAESPFWRRSTTQVMRRPLLAGLPIVALLLVLGLPLLHVRFGTPDDRALPTSVAVRQVGDALRSDFPVQADNTLDVATSARLGPAAAAAYSRRLSALDGVVQVVGPAGTWGGGQRVSPPDAADARYTAPHATWISATIRPDPLSAAAGRLVGQARALPTPPGITAAVGGSAANLVDQKHDIGSRLPLGGLLIALTTLIVLWVFTGSLLLPLKALALNALTLTATLGVVVWIFQDGHLAGLFGATALPMNTTMPLLLFCIAFGLSMDYEVFVLSRIKDLHDAGRGNEEAVVGGLARSGRIVTTAAALLAVTFFAVATSKVSFIQLFGAGTGLAILIDAGLVRGVLVPAFMRVAGDANWWSPRLLRRAHGLLGPSDVDPLALPEG